jgi:acetyl-CoA acetyltransferase
VTIDGVITGFGITELTRPKLTPEIVTYGPTDAGEYAIRACRLALADAGIEKDAVDGLLVVHSPMTPCVPLGIEIQGELGLGDLHVLQDIHAEGSSAMQMLHNAVLYVSAGMAKHVLCVFADTPVVPGQASGDSYAVTVPHGHIPGWEGVHGLFGAASAYGLCARRHMAEFGTSDDHFAAVAVAARQWAAGNDRALARKLLTIEEHHASPWVADPFRRYDCAFPVNGGMAMVISAAAVAAECGGPVVHVTGIGQGHRANSFAAGGDIEVRTPATEAADGALRMAGVTHNDIDICQLYDCFSYATIVLLEDLGFCPKGEGGPFVADGHIGPGGSIPTNTGGGQLSSYYMQGMTPISEAVIQLRGDGGDRQVDGAQLALVQGHGGILTYHGCAILSAVGPTNS